MLFLQLILLESMTNLQKLKNLAKKKGISIRDLADRVGLKENQIHVMCRTNSTKIDTLDKIAKELGVSISYFFEENIYVKKEVYNQYGHHNSQAREIGTINYNRESTSTDPNDEIRLLTGQIALLRDLLDEKNKTIERYKSKYGEI